VTDGCVTESQIEGGAAGYDTKKANDLSTTYADAFLSLDNCRAAFRALTDYKGSAPQTAEALAAGGAFCLGKILKGAEVDSATALMSEGFGKLFTSEYQALGMAHLKKDGQTLRPDSDWEAVDSYLEGRIVNGDVTFLVNIRTAAFWAAVKKSQRYISFEAAVEMCMGDATKWVNIDDTAAEKSGEIKWYNKSWLTGEAKSEYENICKTKK